MRSSVFGSAWCRRWSRSLPHNAISRAGLRAIEKRSSVSKPQTEPDPHPSGNVPPHKATNIHGIVLARLAGPFRDGVRASQRRAARMNAPLIAPSMTGAASRASMDFDGFSASTMAT